MKITIMWTDKMENVLRIITDQKQNKTKQNPEILLYTLSATMWKYIYVYSNNQVRLLNINLWTVKKKKQQTFNPKTIQVD